LNLNLNPLKKSPTLGALHIVLEGTLCPSKTYTGLRSFSGIEFEAYLRRSAEEILDCAVHMVIEDVERAIFEEETSSVTM